jgi:hypothetical protein
MKVAATLFAVVLAGTSVLHAQKPFVVSKSFPTHGALMMEVNLGEVRIVRSDDSKTLRLTIEPRGEGYDDVTMQSWVRRFDVAGDRAAIAVKMPKQFHNNTSSPRVTVYLPAHTDIKFEMGAGQLTVKGIQGNKDLHVDVGQLTVGIEDSAEYSEIHTSSKLGQANDHVSDEHSGGFFPGTNHASAQGLYRLNATVDIGQVDVVHD